MTNRPANESIRLRFSVENRGVLLAVTQQSPGNRIDSCGERKFRFLCCQWVFSRPPGPRKIATLWSQRSAAPGTRAFPWESMGPKPAQYEKRFQRTNRFAE